MSDSYSINKEKNNEILEITLDGVLNLDNIVEIKNTLSELDVVENNVKIIIKSQNLDLSFVQVIKVFKRKLEELNKNIEVKLEVPQNVSELLGTVGIKI